MKPSVILYKTLPDDLLQRLEEHFSVTQVKNLRPETVSGSTLRPLLRLKACWAPAKRLTPRCWRRCRSACDLHRIRWL